MPQKLLDSTIGRIKNTSEQFISIIIAQKLMLHSQKYVFFIFGRKVNYLRAPFGNAFHNMDQGTHTCNPSFLFLHMCLRSHMDLACKDLEQQRTECFWYTLCNIRKTKHVNLKLKLNSCCRIRQMFFLPALGR